MKRSCHNFACSIASESYRQGQNENECIWDQTLQPPIGSNLKNLYEIAKTEKEIIKDLEFWVPRS